jgi:hypothetical protein
MRGGDDEMDSSNTDQRQETAGLLGGFDPSRHFIKCYLDASERPAALISGMIPAGETPARGFEEWSWARQAKEAWGGFGKMVR